MADGCELFRARLSNLLLQSLARIADAFVLVRVRWTQAAHFRRDLSNFLPVDAREREFGLLWVDRAIHARGQRILDRMGKAEAEDYHPLAFHFRTITDADNLQFASPALGDAFDSVVHESSGQPVNRRL